MKSIFLITLEKVENSVCQTTAECKDTMKCRDGKCKCTDLEYWDSEDEQCFLSTHFIFFYSFERNWRL